ncbi:Chain length determinant protein [Labilithrix luteola]|uniref:Chain length determinant protein n=1 Tax=Labilithrix luteola TaxID=1391654 RepID=A0A0K1Q1F8_9BACT|nr:hypothetical protein [Labilithrix luteola]AKU99229.1 Chain length determinant protein [Labilithrix luteola]
MARIEEATLFRPDPKLQYPGRPGGGGGGPAGGGGGGGDDDDGPNIAIRERISEAARSARRRKGLSAVVMMICGALTVLGAIFAPRTYEVESRVLVQRTNTFNGQNQQYLSPEETRNIAKEYEEQVTARDNIIAIVRQKNLVERWDDMRQPHRRLIDKINRKLGKAGPSDEDKYDALVGNIQQRLKVWVDATTVTVKLDWAEPTAARDIVDAAVKNFLDARYQSEVGVIPARLKIQETFVSQAHKDLEASAAELVRLTKANDPNKRANVYVPALPQGVGNRAEPPAEADPALKARLDTIRQQIAVLNEAKIRRSTELEQQLIEKRQTLAEGHPEIVALKQTIAATSADPPQLASLKAQEREILAEMNAQQKAAQQKAADAAKAALPRATTPAPAVPEKTPEVAAATAPKNVQDAQVQFDTVTAKYQTLVKQMQDLQVELQTAEAAYKNRYKITQPADVPTAPKRPVALIALGIGLLATIAAILLVAAIADRFSGIFYEPRDVRDRLGLPVFATFS